MPDDLQRGLFFPGEAAAATVSAPAAAPAVPAAAAPATRDPSAEAAAAVLALPKKKGPSRRLVLRWVGWGSVLALLGGLTNGFLQFFRPGKTSPFGGVITAGTVNDPEIKDEGDVKQVTEGKFWLTHVPEGFIALWWKCPHLGCTVPWKPTDPVMPGDESYAREGRFNCPCHGSIYNRYGQIIQGPAPRPMDRFPLTITPDGKILVDTGKPITRDVAGPEGAVSA